MSIFFLFLHHLGYAQWQVDRSQDEVFLATQEAAGQNRDAQGKPNVTFLYMFLPLTIEKMSDQRFTAKFDFQFV